MSPQQYAGKSLSTEHYFNIFYKNRMPPVDFLQNYAPPKELLIMVLNRKLMLQQPNQQLLKKYIATFFGSQFPILADEATTGRELYELVWMKVRYMLNLSAHKRSLLWWNEKSEASRGAGLAPFALKFVDLSGVCCSLCHWSSKCHGCVVQPDYESPIYNLLLRNTYIACEWNLNFLETHFEVNNMNSQEH